MFLRWRILGGADGDPLVVVFGGQGQNGSHFEPKPVLPPPIKAFLGFESEWYCCRELILSWKDFGAEKKMKLRKMERTLILTRRGSLLPEQVYRNT
ncbi:hypothetical protein EZV62_022646 [Acer yangbiense]|uniref:Uncharacterized protein n=1 Tax=Acer yangbiense TaxID=1000413 RepID=A0A5C7H926_9ROSI|nr:hypothetical protein EZV62_022646 [Acer yangbiense]